MSEREARGEGGQRGERHGGFFTRTGLVVMQGV